MGILCPGLLAMMPARNLMPRNSLLWNNSKEKPLPLLCLCHFPEASCWSLRATRCWTRWSFLGVIQKGSFYDLKEGVRLSRHGVGYQASHHAWML